MIRFFDKRLKLLFWFAKIIKVPIISISIKLTPKKYKLNETAIKEEWEENPNLILPDCEDRSEEYEILLKQNIPTDASLQKLPFVTRDFFICKIEKRNF